jgi:hypothetical protein
MPQYQSQIHIPEISGISDADAVKINLNLISVQRLINIATLIVFGFYLRGCKLSFKGIGLYYNCRRGGNADRRNLIGDSALKIPRKFLQLTNLG